MVAVVSGNGLGLLNGSLGVLGGQGSVGSSSQGRLGESVYVNAATGNLIVSHLDDAIISGRGANGLARTYNSQGMTDGDNNDGWRIGVYRSLGSLIGTVNTANSSIQKTESDGSITTFTYDTSLSRYVSKDGSGAYETLNYNGTSWGCFDGDFHMREVYDWISGTGKLLFESDLDGNKITYGYTGSLITSITTQNVKGTITETIALNYSGTLLSNITFNGSDDAGVAKSSRRVSYAYTSNRLTNVTVDLSPDDLSTADNKLYSTNYTYDANGRLWTMTQSDGTSLTFTYDANGRVANVKDALNRTTSYDYSVAGQLTITDALALQTVITFETAAGNSNGYIKTIKYPSTQVVTYTYTTNGDIASVNDGFGNISYSYDSNGNLLQQWDAAGDTVSYTYDSANRKLSETHYTGIDADGAGTTYQASGAQTTRYVYDAGNLGHLRFTISPEGRVTERVYSNVTGRKGALTSSISYNAALYTTAGTPTEAQLATWVAGIDKSQGQRTDYVYDWRGQVSTSTQYVSLNADGTGNTSVAANVSTSTYIYDARGQLLKTIDANLNPTVYAYDGMGRVIGSTNALSQSSVTSYDDAGKKVTVDYANGRKVVSTFDAAGQLTSVMESNSGLSDLGTTRYYYDADGNERMRVDATGQRFFTLYNAAGFKLAEIDNAGGATLYQYSINGLLRTTNHYANPLSSAAFVLGGANSLLNADGTPSALALGLGTNTWNTLYSAQVVSFDTETALDVEQDTRTFYLYDAAGRLGKTLTTVSSSATTQQTYITEYLYDGANRQIKIIHYATPATVAGWVINGVSYIPATTKSTDIPSPALTSADRITRTFYDNDGLKRGDLDAEGYLTEYQYDNLGRLNHSIRYATLTSVANRDSGTLASLIPAISPQDQHSYTLYDSQSRVIGDIDPEGYLTEYTYDNAGNKTKTTKYATTLWDDGGIGGFTFKNRWTNLYGSGPDSGGWNSQDLFPRLSGDINGDGKSDILALGLSGGNILLSTGNGIYGAGGVTGFSYNDGWTSQNTSPRMLADMNGDGKADLVGFAADGMYVALSTGTGFSAKTLWTGSYGSSAAAGGWTSQDLFPRLSGDINGDGKSDILALGLSGGNILLSTGNGIYGAGGVTGFSYNDGWTSQNTSPRMLADMNGDGKADLVGFAADGMYVALSTGTGFSAKTLWTGSYGSSAAAGGWSSQDLFPRLAGDISGDGKSDILALGLVGANLLKSTGTGIYGAGGVTGFSYSDGWTSQNTYPRILADMNGDGKADLVGFAADGMYVSKAINFTKIDYLRPVASSKDITTTKTYDALNRLSTETSVDGTVTQYLYNSGGQLESKTVALGAVEPHSVARTTRYSYDLDGQLVTVTQAEGGVTTNYYDAANRLIKTVSTNGLDANGIASKDNVTLYYYGTTYTYDAGGNTPRLYNYTVDALGYVTRTSTNPLGQVTETRKSAKAITDTAFLTSITNSSASGRVIASGDAIITTLNTAFDFSASSLDQRSSTTYTINGLVQAVQDALGNTTTYQTYNAFGQATQIDQVLGDGTGRTVSSKYEYDHRGSTTKTYSDSTGFNLLTQASYDAFGRVISTTDAANNTRTTQYDRLGRTLQITDALTNSRSMTYDAFGRVLTQSDAYGNKTLTSYDDVNRTVTVTSPEGVITTTTKTRHGQTLSIKDGLNNTTSYSYDKNGNLKQITNPDNSTQKSDFDAGNRLIASYDGNNVKTIYSYDAINRQLSRTVDPTGLAVTTTTSYSSTDNTVTQTDANGVVTTTTFDAKGQAVLIKVAVGTADETDTQITYDALGHKTQVIEGFKGTDYSEARTTVYTYDTLGRRITETIKAAKDVAGTGVVDLITRYSYDANSNVIDKTDANGNVTRYVYDAENRLIYTVDALGAVSELSYDNNNRAIKTRQYANTINLGLLPVVGTKLALSDISSKITVNANLDRSSQTAYNKDGRVVAELAANNQLTRKEYDATGNLVRVTRFATLVAANTTLTASTTVTTTAQDQVTRYVYDQLNRVVYTLDALNFVNRTSYDAAGNVTGDTRYELAYGNASDLPTKTTMDSWMATQSGRSSLKVYDLAGRLKYTLDNTRHVTETVYAANSNRVDATIRYANAITTFSYAYTAAGVLAELTPNASKDETVRFGYDLAGRLTSQTDSLNNFETYSYTKLGLKKSFTNKNGAAFTWNYEYDAAGRMVKEITPTVNVIYYTETPGSNTLNRTPLSTRIETSYRYDGAGNLRYRVEASNIAGQTRTTEYQYDQLGHQVKTLLPTVGLDTSSNAIDDNIYGNATLDRNAAGWNTQTQAYSQVQYDTFGNAVVNRDVMGNYNYKTYDNLNRVIYEVDGEGYVTQHGYDVFGNETTLVRYSKRITIDTPGIAQSGDNVKTAVDKLNDTAPRTLTNSYDKNNHVIQVSEDSLYHVDSDAASAVANSMAGSAFSKITTNSYNAFGEVIRQAVSLDSEAAQYANTSGKTSDSYTYYNSLGQKIAEVNAEGYLTTHAYDAFGNHTSQTEYSTALAAGWNNSTKYGTLTSTSSYVAATANSKDRQLDTTYDQLNRKTADIRVNTEYDISTGLLSDLRTTGNLTTNYSYDKVGNLVKTTDAQSNSSTRQYYDTLGRNIATINPTRQGYNGSTSTTITPLTENEFNAFGQVVRTYSYAASVDTATINDVAISYAHPVYTTTGTAVDRQTLHVYDISGREIATQQLDSTDSSKNITTLKTYDALGRVSKDLVFNNNATSNNNSVHAYLYDKAGHQTGTLTRTRTKSVDSFGKDMRVANVSLSYTTSSIYSGGGYSQPPAHTDLTTALSYSTLGDWGMSRYWVEVSYSADGIAKTPVVIDINPNSNPNYLSVTVASIYQSTAVAFSNISITLKGSRDGQVYTIQTGTGSNATAASSGRKLLWQRSLNHTEVGDAPVLKYKTAGGSWSAGITAQALGNCWAVDVSNFPAGFVDYEAVYTRAGESTPYARVRGTYDSTMMLGSFETPAQGNGYTYRPVDATWTYLNDAGISGSSSGFTGDAPKATDGGQVAFLQRLGKISRSVNLTANTVLRFNATQRVNAGSGLQQIRLLIDGVQQGDIITPPRGYYETYTFNLGSMTGVHTLSIEGLVSGADVTAFIDRIAVGDELTVQSITGSAIDSPSSYVATYQNGIAQERVLYNAFGEISDKAFTDGAPVAGETTAQYEALVFNNVNTHYDYDQAGRAWRVKENGVSTVNLYNSRGQVAVQVKSAGIDLGSSIVSSDMNAFANTINLSSLNSINAYQRNATWHNKIGQVVRQQQAVFDTQWIDSAGTPTVENLPTACGGVGVVSNVVALNDGTRTYDDGVTLNWSAIRAAFAITDSVDALKVVYTYHTTGGSDITLTVADLNPNLTSTSVTLATGLIASFPTSQYTVTSVKVYAKVNGAYQTTAVRDSAINTKRLSVPKPAQADRALLRYRDSSANPKNTPWSQLFVDIGSDGRYFVDLTPRTGLVAGTKYDYQVFFYNENVTVPDANSLNVAVRALASGAGSFYAGSSGSVSQTTAQINAPAIDVIAPVSFQTMDRWGNVTQTQTALGEVTNNAYNDNNQLITSQSAAVKVLSASGVETTENLTTAYFYDALGRKIGQQDAESFRVNGGLQRAWVYDNAGDLIAERLAASNNFATNHYYDAFGGKVRTTDPLFDPNSSNLTNNYANHYIAYENDAFGRVVKQQRGSGTTETYVYNALGQRIETHNWMDTTGTARLVQQQDYDAFGRVVRTAKFDYSNYATRTFTDFNALSILLDLKVWGSGLETAFEYDAQGHKIREYNSQGDEQSWSYSQGGQLLTHKDLGGITTTTTYNYDGTLQQQINDRDLKEVAGIRQKLNYSYDAAGHQTQIIDGSVASRNQKFRYDALGRQVVSLFNDASNIVVNGNSSNISARTSSEYDAAGRLINVVTGDGSNLTYAYDANSNRRRTRGRYRDSSNVSNFKERDYWYQYDRADRMTIGQGRLNTTTSQIEAAGKLIVRTYSYVGSGSGGSVYVGTDTVTQDPQGILVTYDAAGQRLTANTKTSTEAWQYETYSYDDDGRLKVIKRYNGTSTFEADVSTKLALMSDRTYDNANRVIKQTTYDLSLSTQRQGTSDNFWQMLANPGAIKEYRVNTFDGAGRTIRQQVYDKNNKQFNDIKWTLDVNGLTRSYKVVSTEDNNGYTNTYVYDYKAYDSFKEAKITGTSTKFTPAATTETYDANGNITGLTDNADNNHSRSFVTDLNNRIIKKESVDVPANKKGQSYLYAEGSERMSFGSMETINLDEGYTPIADSSVGTTPGSYTVTGGETLQNIAANTWGDSSLWYIIAEANNLGSSATLTPGQTLTIPNRVTNSRNASDTVKPYNPNAIIGDTTPRLQPPKDKCVVLSQIIGVVVAVVVTCYTGGNAAAGAAAGSAAQQHSLNMLNGRFDWGRFLTQSLKTAAVSMLTGGDLFMASALTATKTSEIFDPLAAGEKKDINYEQVAVAAAAGYAGGAVAGVAGGAGSIAGSMAGAAASYGTSYVLNTMLGNKPDFSWRTLGASVVGAGLTSALSGASWTNGSSGAIAPTVEPFTWTGAAMKFLQGVGNSAVTYGVQKAFGDTTAHWDWSSVAANALGEAIGYGLTQNTKYEREQARLAKEGAAETPVANAPTVQQETPAVTSDEDEPLIPWDGYSASGEAAVQSQKDGIQLQADREAEIDLRLANTPETCHENRFAPGSCFARGTLVHTKTGTQAIETIRVGDYVAARHQANVDSPLHWRKVTDTFQHTDKLTIDLLVTHANGETEVITTTTEHPFYVSDKGWVATAELVVGDRLEMLEGSASTLSEITSGKGLQTVYNFTVDEDHTYFVGARGVWVHNSYWDTVKEYLPLSDDPDLRAAFSDANPGTMDVPNEFFKKAWECTAALVENSPEILDRLNAHQIAMRYKDLPATDPRGVEANKYLAAETAEFKEGMQKTYTAFIDGDAKEKVGILGCLIGPAIATHKANEALGKLNALTKVEEGVLTAEGNGLTEKYNIALNSKDQQNALSAQTEIRVFEWITKKLKLNLKVIDPKVDPKLTNDAVVTGKITTIVDGIRMTGETRVEIKRLGGLGSNAAKNLLNGVEQVGPNGLLIVVRAATAKASLKEMTDFVKKFDPSKNPKINYDPKNPVKIIVVDEVKLPPFNPIALKVKR